MTHLRSMFAIAAALFLPAASATEANPQTERKIYLAWAYCMPITQFFAESPLGREDDREQVARRQAWVALAVSRGVPLNDALFRGLEDTKQYLTLVEKRMNECLDLGRDGQNPACFGKPSAAELEIKERFKPCFNNDWWLPPLAK